jgi:leader peptidase (prepilin peptidase)/N-methyltransferase
MILAKEGEPRVMSSCCKIDLLSNSVEMRVIFGCVLTGIVVALAALDLQKMILPDRMNLLLGASGIGQSVVLGSPNPTNAALGGLIGALCLMIIATLFRRWRGFDGLGFGDVKFVAAAGIWTGWQGLPLMLSIASTSALAFVAIRAVWKREFDRMAALPFGPFLGLGALLTWLAMATSLGEAVGVLP